MKSFSYVNTNAVNKLENELDEKLDTLNDALNIQIRDLDYRLNEMGVRCR